jgi:SAM-dependent methyltransferase
MEANFFEPGSPFLKHPLLTPERTAGEIDFILSVLPLESGERILDIGCGFGRHSNELARRGFDVLGIDPSPAMIAAARENSASAGLTLEFRQQRGEDLQAVDQFKVALCLFTTLGQVSGQGDNLALLENAYRALEPGGWFMLEIPQRAWAVSNLKPSERIGEGDRYALVARSFDYERDLVSEEFTIVSPDGQQSYLLQYRLFSRAEINHYLEQAGYVEITFYDGYADTPLGDNSPTMVVRARKPA